jgi:hypothetical protein
MISACSIRTSISDGTGLRAHGRRGRGNGGDADELQHTDRRHGRGAFEAAAAGAACPPTLPAAAILFIDEGASHLDIAKEREGNGAVKELAFTLVVIARRPARIHAADRVVGLRNGATCPA